jgi:DNA replication protein DnaC
LENNCQYCGGAKKVHPIKDGIVIYSESIDCVCSKKENEKHRKELILKTCGFPPFAESMTLEKFKVYPEVQKAYNTAKKIASTPNELFWLALVGENGNGKTHLAISICKAWLKAGVPAKYTFVPLLLDELKEGFRYEREGDYELSYTKRFDYYCNVALLLLDDYGAESDTAWVQEKLDTIVDYRLMHNLSLIVTSNVPLDDMPHRIRSRIARHPNGEVINIDAIDYTLKDLK